MPCPLSLLKVSTHMQKAPWMRYRDPSGVLPPEDFHFDLPTSSLWQCPHRAEVTAQEGLLTNVHRRKNLWGSYEVVCFSSE